LAYVGPGAGFVLVASLALLGAIGAAALALLAWPFRTLWRLIRGKPRDGTAISPPLASFARRALRFGIRGARPIVLVMAAASVCHGDDWQGSTSRARVIVLGFDGMDYAVTRDLMARGRMPNFSALAASGSFNPLESSVPAQSPVAWSSFITGMDPGGHGIFDFIHRDSRTMIPYLSTTRTEPPAHHVTVGSWQLPMSRAHLTLLRDGQPFWDVLEQHGVRTTIMRVPANFPPSGRATRELSGMGTPDILGTYGTFSFFTSAADTVNRGPSGGRIVPVDVVDDVVRAEIVGPANPFRTPARQVRVPFTVHIDPRDAAARIAVGDQERVLKVGEWSDWIPIAFPLMPLQQLHGMCRFYLKQTRPAFELYVSPVNLDPARPAMPISTPASFAAELAEATGRFHTQGIAEDTKGLIEGVLTRDEFLQQAGFAAAEAARQYRRLLDDFNGGLLFYHFGNLDQVSHVMWRARDPGHPAYDAARDAAYQSVVDDLYVAFDRIVGDTLQRMGPGTTLIVMSDHGFASWRRVFHLNSWLREQGYLTVLDPDSQDDSGLFQNVDWSRTQAYGLGLNGLYINVRGRERGGIVPEAERAGLVEEIRQRLLHTIDPATQRAVVADARAREVIYADATHFDVAPDLIVGYAEGTRVSNESALGAATGSVFADNRSEWSGDHCMDHRAVPGILLTSRPLRQQAGSLDKIAGAILGEFGIKSK
jgi:predicted AlkP superfamily phosphohydrolase/phosphomutase